MPYTVSDCPTRFRATEVTRIVRALSSSSPQLTRIRWLGAIASRVINQRPDLEGEFVDFLGVEPIDGNPLSGMSVGEIGVCYEALLAGLDSASRKSSGQYFTPDDAAHFMARFSKEFPKGKWLDPCCGVGNLSWHLADVQEDSGQFVRDFLILGDRDRTALLSAVAIVGADFLPESDRQGFRSLRERCVVQDFLEEEEVPEHDFVIVNPPYARDVARPGFETSSAREMFSFFLERIAKCSKGFISVTPASYLSAPKFKMLRGILSERLSGGTIFSFDNVPDTIFRGYKFGSSNTSTTNFVRAAVTVCSPSMGEWKTTPIVRWKSSSRGRMFLNVQNLLSRMFVGPGEEWTKVPPGFEDVWKILDSCSEKIGDIVTSSVTPYHLSVALTPRYYISAAFQDLRRGSKEILYFRTKEDRDRAAAVLNSSIPYFWWRVLDGGVTLPKRVLKSVPVPEAAASVEDLVAELEDTEESCIVRKLNAGMLNENVKRPWDLVYRLNERLLPGTLPDFTSLYSSDMFSSDLLGSP